MAVALIGAPLLRVYRDLQKKEDEHKEGIEPYYTPRSPFNRILLNPLGLASDRIPDLSNAGRGKCPECFEPARPCCGCLGRVCPNGHLSKKSKHFTPCPKHVVLDFVNKTTSQKIYELFVRPGHIKKPKSK